MKVMFTATSERSAKNWQSALHALRRRGHEVLCLAMPILGDPDHIKPPFADFDLAATIPVAPSLREISPELSVEIATCALPIVLGHAPDALLLTTCHAGPELALARMLYPMSGRPIIAGCQHGFVQNWDQYWNNFFFDCFFVFGPWFRKFAPPDLAVRLVPASLSKLDDFPACPRPPFSEDMRPILFAAQKKYSENIASALQQIECISGRRVLIRPHPEFPNVYDRLGLTVVPTSESLAERLRQSSLLITTGSTVVMEALAAGVPAVVLPEERGDNYAPAGLVSKDCTASAILEKAAETQDAKREKEIRNFLAAVSGATDPIRAELGAAAIERALLERL